MQGCTWITKKRVKWRVGQIFFFSEIVPSRWDGGNGGAGYRCTNWRVLVSFTTVRPNYALPLGHITLARSLRMRTPKAHHPHGFSLRFYPIKQFTRYKNGQPRDFTGRFTTLVTFSYDWFHAAAKLRAFSLGKRQQSALETQLFITPCCKMKLLMNSNCIRMPITIIGS